MASDATIGSRWQLRGDGMPWSVVQVKDGRIALSGPGPCRGMKYVEDWEFYADWRQVQEVARGNSK